LELTDASVDEKLVLDMNKYYHILSEPDTKTLLTNLEALFTRIILLEVHNKKLRRKIARQSILNKNHT
jgi:hypothetical protein